MKFIVIGLLVLQFGPRTPLTPAETLLEPAILKAIESAPVDIEAPPQPLIRGTDATAGEIAIVVPRPMGVGEAGGYWAMHKLDFLVESKQLPRPSRAIRFVRAPDPTPPPGTRAAIFVTGHEEPTLQVVRGLWSTASISDEVVEVFAGPSASASPHREVGQPKWDAFGVPATTIIGSLSGDGPMRASIVTAAAAYFLATLPNAGAEALLSHLTVGAHARLAEDGRRAVAQMGNQQRAGADVLVMFGQAIEREQRRMRSFERFMPEPVDPMLRSRIADMEKGITGVWTSIGITSSPFVPPAERLRGRSGEDRRVPARSTGVVEDISAPVALRKLPNVSQIAYELTNFIDGRRSISDIRDAVSAEFGSVPLPAVVEYFEQLAKARVITLRGQR